ncbi:peptide/nickel transport system permease protein [Alicyclobacillus sacchari]|uniref:Peptide/nickel transport system permease protein n=1 Tax=Alicyclobacillus sacchari TaxID=392010 RepID=A0A4R8LUF1_9BACL|nr:ABC transporter permease [Alicyclobacillus sacchari]TDY51400.1 peptide/nickel transport system permease protein [Alicyclobacillus sacchari]
MAIAVSQAGPVAAPKRHSQFYLGWKRFSKNYFAVAGLVWVAIFFIVGIIGPWIAPYSYKDADFLAMHTGPSWKHLFGTDTVGYDVFSQILFSIRYALEIALGATCVSFVIGVILGLWAGLAGGIADVIIMRGVDFMFALPSFFFALILVVLLGKGLGPMMLAIGVPGWAGYARLIRSLVLSMRNGEMVEAARALGASQSHIAFKYMFPNVVGSMVVSLAFGIPYDLTAQAGLSIVGMGLNPPMPSFGNMLAAAGENILGFPWLLYFPAGIFAITLLSFLFVADGLQEAFSPKGGM